MRNYLLCFTTVLFLNIFSYFPAGAQEIKFGFHENMPMGEGDQIVEPAPKYINIHRQSIAFLAIQMPINRIVINDSLEHYYSVVYKSDLEELVQRARQSNMITGFKTVEIEERNFRILKTKNNQILACYNEPNFETKICINTLTNTVDIQNWFYENIDNWLKKID